MTRGEVLGTTAHERAVRLAGALAEAGVVGLTLRRPGAADEPLRARHADLPGVIVAAPVGSVLEGGPPPIRVEIGPTRLVWESGDAGTIQALSGG